MSPCLIRSDPAQQSAPRAPEGGALGGGPPGPPPNMSSNLRLQQSQAQMEEVVSIMSVNVEKVLDRDIRLTEMDGKAEALEAGASVFKTSAGKLKRKYWWKNCKMMIMLGVICAIVMVAIVRKYHIESEWRVREPPSLGNCHLLPFG
ncbi:vesicle-associated membrane protein 1 isoform X1 [Terrapene carolina triunguis]|uniref:vesicle-associated membrane protein 1 isoform X1 n=1 Tax=Terrapene triunguis TaxID=2587831 RepID=UPI000CEFE956|nr:vesicle-associated membrane protein 1 isoform X1 [Terrapene carolina triunguis]